MLRLYRAPFSTNVERVALALAHKRLEIVVPDSVAILRYLEEKWPGRPLFPSDRARRAELDVFLEWFNQVWKVAPNAIEEELERGSPDERRIEEMSGRMRVSLDRYEAMLDGRDHLFGHDFSAADCAAFPFLKYARRRDPEDDELFHRILEDNLQLDGAFPGLSAWIDRVNERPRA